MSHFIISVSLIGVATFTGIISTLLVFIMIGEVNRKKNEGSQIPYFGHSLAQVWKEYKSYYPQGIYAKAFIASVVLTGIVSVLFFVLVFVVFSGTAPPSR